MFNEGIKNALNQKGSGEGTEDTGFFKQILLPEETLQGRGSIGSGEWINRRGGGRR